MVRLLSSSGGLAAALLVAGAPGLSWAAVGNPGAGRGVFTTQCSACHSDARSRPTIVGPPLFGVVGRQAGAVSGYPYSTAMRSAGFAWTPDRLRSYLPAPRDYLPGVRMTYGGLKNTVQLDDLIAYLQTLK
jgi:cytochrome c